MEEKDAYAGEKILDLLNFQELTREYNLSVNQNFLFLQETLIAEVRRRCRRGTTFFAPRSWRKPVKHLQVAAIRHLKNCPDEASVRAIACEVAACALTITNGKPYNFVCGVPGGSSRKKENFGSLIARFVADELDIRYCAPLATGTAGKCSTSHPRQSMNFRSRYVGGVPEGSFGLLVDDVATSGSHFADCVSQLRKQGISVVCVSWIG